MQSGAVHFFNQLVANAVSMRPERRVLLFSRRQRPVSALPASGRTALRWVTTAFVVFALGLGLVTFVLWQKSLDDARQDALGQAAQAAASRFGQLLGDFERSSAALAAGPAILAAVQDPDAPRSNLRAVIQHSTLRERFGARILVLDAAGDAIAGGVPELSGEDILGLVPRPITPEDVTTGVALDDWGLALSIPVLHPDTGIAVGRLLSVVDLDELFAHLRRALPEDTQWTLLAGAGNPDTWRGAGRVVVPVRVEGALQFIDLHVHAQRRAGENSRPRGAAAMIWLVLYSVLVLAALLIMRRRLVAAWTPPGTSTTLLGPPAAPGRGTAEVPSGRGPVLVSTQARQIETALANLDDVVVSVTAGGRRIRYISDPVLRMTGRSPQDLIADSEGLLSLVSEASRGPLGEALAKAAGISAVMRVPAVRKADGSGGITWLDIRYRKAANDPEQTVVCLLRDVTDRVLLEARSAAVDAELELCDRALAAASNGIEIIGSQDSGYRVHYVNPALCRMTGSSREELLGRPSQLFDRPDPSPSLRRTLASMSMGKGGTTLHRSIRPDGTSFWEQIRVSAIDTQEPAVARFIAVHSDVTELIETANELRSKEARLSLMFALSPDGLALIDATGRVFMANEALLRFFGLSLAQVIGRTAQELSLLLEPRAVAEEVWEGLPCPDDAVSYVDADLHHRRRAKRHTLHLQDPKKVLVGSVKPIPGSINSEYVLYMRDITREHEFNAMKSDFLSTATHELRTPMACILGFAEMLAEGLSTAEDAPEHARLIYEQASEMSRTLDDLLDLARMEARRAGALAFVPESAAGIAAELARTWRVTGDPRSIQLQVACGAEVSVSVDSQKIRQVLRNLLSNAFKYSAAPSPVRLCVQAVPAGPVVFTVTDEGMGMTPDEARHAFDRFFRAEAMASVKGTGLGLSLVKQIVELHGGAVRLSSAVGEGTVVSVELPQILYSRDDSPALDDEGRGLDAA